MDNYQIETAQNVSISQNIADLGIRMLAFLIDILVIIAYEVIMFFGLTSLEMDGRAQWVYYLVLGLPPFLYHLLSETFWNGRSLGKAALRLRVVKIDGSPASFSNFLIRWLLRLIDISISSGGVAVVCIIFNEKGQRLGDIAAKTTVISERQRIRLKDTLGVEIETGYQPEYPQVTVFSDKDMRIINRLYQKSIRTHNQTVLQSLSGKMQTVMQIQTDEAPDSFIAKAIKDYNYYTQQ